MIDCNEQGSWSRLHCHHAIILALWKYSRSNNHHFKKKKIKYLIIILHKQSPPFIFFVSVSQTNTQKAETKEHPKRNTEEVERKKGDSEAENAQSRWTDGKFF